MQRCEIAFGLLIALVMTETSSAQIPDVPRRSYAQPSSGPTYRASSGRSLNTSVPRRTSVRGRNSGQSFRYRIVPDANSPFGVNSRRTYHRIIGPVNALEYSSLPAPLGRITFDRLNRNVVLPPRFQPGDQVIVPHVLLDVEPLVVPNSDLVVMKSRQPESKLQTGWDLLNRGEDTAALRMFAEASLKNPRDGKNRFGYALVLAFNGDFARSAFSFRRACDTEAAAIGGLNVGPDLAKRILDLLPDISEEVSKRDQPFVRAVLQRLAGQTENAKKSLSAAEAASDKKSSTQKLRAILGQ